MPLEILPYSPIGGINQEDAEDSVGPTEAVSSSNFLFERGMAITRPGVTSVQLAHVTGDNIFTYAKSFRFSLAAGGPLTLLVEQTPKIYQLLGGLGLSNVPISIGVLAFGSASYFNADTVNGDVLIGNSADGLVRVYKVGPLWGCSYIADAKYRYVVGHMSRAFGAYSLDALAANGPATVGWSVTGDATNWTGLGSNLVVVADIPDEITGVHLVNNVIVILRREGIHLAQPTGTVPAYTIGAWSRKGTGCPYPSTATVDDNVLYFVGPDDVYSFNLYQLTPIGYKIRRELMAALVAGVIYRGFVPRGSSFTLPTGIFPDSMGIAPRIRYHLVPSDPNYPHFVYDIRDQVWSKQLYTKLPFQPTLGFHFIDSDLREGPALVGPSTNPDWVAGTSGMGCWDDTVACQDVASLKGKVLPISDPSKDYGLTRTLLRYRYDGSSDTPRVTLKQSVMLNDDRVEDISDVALAPTSSEGRWMRRWVDIRQTGQDVQVEVEVEGLKGFAVNYIGVQHDQTGSDYRGA